MFEVSAGTSAASSSICRVTDRGRRSTVVGTGVDGSSASVPSVVSETGELAWPDIWLYIVSPSYRIK